MKRTLLGGLCLLLAGSCLTPAQSKPVTMTTQKAAPCSQFRTPVIAAPENIDKAMLMDEKNRTVVARGKVIDPCAQSPQLAQSDEWQKRGQQMEAQRKTKMPQFPLPGEPTPPPAKLKSTAEMLQDSLKLKTPTKP
jgi:hypothetical protein